MKSNRTSVINSYHSLLNNFCHLWLSQAVQAGFIITNWNKSGNIYRKLVIHYLWHIHSEKGKVVFKGSWSSKQGMIGLIAFIAVEDSKYLFAGSVILFQQAFIPCMFLIGQRYYFVDGTILYKKVKHSFQLHIHNLLIGCCLPKSRTDDSLCACSEIRKNILFRPVYSPLKTLNPNCIVFVCF